MSFLDVTRHWPEISRRFPSLTREHCLADMHAVTADGTFAGYDAYRALSKSLPIGWLLRPLLFVPPLPQIGRRLYRHVADRRSRHANGSPQPTRPRARRSHRPSACRTSPDMSARPVPDVSVVVPTYNRSAQLRGLLAALLEQDAGDVTYEVIVIDNNSSDDTRAVVEHAIAGDASARLHTYSRGDRACPTRATPASSARAPIILFMDDDGIPGRDWVRSMKEAFDRYPR